MLKRDNALLIFRKHIPRFQTQQWPLKTFRGIIAFCKTAKSAFRYSGFWQYIEQVAQTAETFSMECSIYSMQYAPRGRSILWHNIEHSWGGWADPNAANVVVQWRSNIERNAIPTLLCQWNMQHAIQSIIIKELSVLERFVQWYASHDCLQSLRNLYETLLYMRLEKCMFYLSVLLY